MTAKEMSKDLFNKRAVEFTHSLDAHIYCHLSHVCAFEPGEEGMHSKFKELETILNIRKMYREALKEVRSLRETKQ